MSLIIFIKLIYLSDKTVKLTPKSLYLPVRPTLCKNVSGSMVFCCYGALVFNIKCIPRISIPLEIESVANRIFI